MYKSYDQLGIDPDKNIDIMGVPDIQNSQHKAHIIANNRIVCIDIYAHWCGPCKQTSPSYSVLASNYSKEGICAIVKQDFDRLEPSERAGINGIPIFRFYFDGKPVDEVIGADIPLVEEKIKGLLQRLNKSSQRVEHAPQGPQFNRSSIRNVRTGVPNIEETKAIPYQPSSGNYHQPYGGNR